MPALDLLETRGYLVADSRGRLLGRVEAPICGCAEGVPDALAVSRGILFRRRHIIPAEAIGVIDPASKVIGLRVPRESTLRF